MAYYLGGYYLIQLRPVEFGSQASNSLHTASDCINNSLLQSWAYSWTTDNDGHIAEIMQQYRLSSDVVSAIRRWVDAAFDAGRIGWPNVFYSLDTTLDYRRTFFSHVADIKMMAVYFSEEQAMAISSAFVPVKENRGQIGLCDSLLNRVPEVGNPNPAESLLGYDIVGIEESGDFHTFHCHDMAADLSNRFGLELNPEGLFKAIDAFEAVTAYMNDPETGAEPVPWFVCKVKMVVE